MEAGGLSDTTSQALHCLPNCSDRGGEDDHPCSACCSKQHRGKGMKQRWLASKHVATQFVMAAVAGRVHGLLSGIPSNAGVDK
jgi:hypothetical protein